jgi:hypothetical protein
MGAGNSSGKANASNMMTKLLKHQVESLDPTTATTKFDSLYKPNGAVIFMVRRMGWKLCREGAAQLMYAGPQIYRQGARLVAIAKERLGHEEFLSDHWNSSGGLRNQWLLNSDADKVSEQENLAAFPNPELYYDTWKDGSLTGVNRLFRVTNGTRETAHQVPL